MATLEVKIQTGGDDLRSGSWANFSVKLQNQAIKTFPEFTGRGGLGNNSNVTKKLEIPELSNPNQIEFFQVQHVSQEAFGQTADNWNLKEIQIILPFEIPSVGKFDIVVGKYGSHRFTGNSRLLTIYPIKG